MDIDTMITTYNTAVTDATSEILGKERRRKKAMSLQRCSRREISRRSGMKQKEQKYTGKQTGRSEGSKESKGGLDRCSVRGD